MHIITDSKGLHAYMCYHSVRADEAICKLICIEIPLLAIE